VGVKLNPFHPTTKVWGLDWIINVPIVLEMLE
jgi:hypothetical protein